MTLKIFEGRYREMLESPMGTVGRFLTVKADAIQVTAKAIATEDGLVRSGNYWESIFARIVNVAGGLAISVGAARRPGRELEYGTEWHIIEKVIDPGRLAFKGAAELGGLYWDQTETHADRPWQLQPRPWPDGPGRPTPRVEHPGNKAYMVLHRAVARVLRGGTA